MSVTETEFTDAVRSAVQDRGALLYLLIQAFKEAGCATDEPVRKALFRFGQLSGARLPPATTPRAFFDGIGATGKAGLPFAREEMSVDAAQGVYHLHRCPMVAAWRNLGASPEEVVHLCELAGCGDQGLISQFPELTMHFNETIAKGDAYCAMVVARNG